ncbi:helix-turn-helix domain-containing protein [Streptomyces sp. NPDC102381]|uniref:helix-turn-helix domain-containing protein n=1 Tax=Streptomyces sp. NPDC102381 TaxID=3366164 RepID=UPI003829FF8F
MTDQDTPTPADTSTGHSQPPPPAPGLEQLLSLTPDAVTPTIRPPTRARPSAPSVPHHASRAAGTPSTEPATTHTPDHASTREHRDERSVPARDVRLFTADQAADLLQIPASWLRKKAAAGQIAHTRIGRHLRFCRADLEQLINNGRRSVGRRPLR